MPISPINDGVHPPVDVDPMHKPRSTELSPDDFMKLFITQLQHQNPTSPMDSSTMLQQMANLGQLSAAKSAEATMKDVQATVKSTLAQSQVIGATQLIGKKVHFDTRKNLSPMIPKDGISGSVLVEHPSTNVKVTIKDTAGKEVKTLELGPATSSGLMDFHWDGMVDGKEVPADMYQISAVSTVNGKDSAPLKAAGAFKISSVALDQRNNSLILNVEGYGGLTMQDIVKIIN